MQFPQVAQAVVNTFEPEPGTVELVAYYSLNKGAEDLQLKDISQTMRGQLPPYMVPAYFERLDVIPMTTSNKADRKNLPAPKGGRVASAGDNYVAPRTPNEELLAAAMARALKVDKVSVTGRPFLPAVLGPHLVLMARFCSDIRQSGQVRHLQRDVLPEPHHRAAGRQAGIAGQRGRLCRWRLRKSLIPSNFAYYSCEHCRRPIISASRCLAPGYCRSDSVDLRRRRPPLTLVIFKVAAFFVAGFVGFSALPIVAKWLLIGRFKEESFPIWGVRYFCFWVVKALIRSAPLAAFRGSPIYNVYLRLLGAKIGRDVVIQSTFVPVTADLFSVGEGTFLSKMIVVGYKAQGNRIHIGAIAIGANAFVGEASVLAIDTAMADDTQLGHASSLQRGQRVPAGKRYHGSPAVETSADYCRIEPRHCSTLRRWIYALAPALPAIILAPIGIMLAYWWAPPAALKFVEMTGETPTYVPSATIAAALAAAARSSTSPGWRSASPRWSRSTAARPSWRDKTYVFTACITHLPLVSGSAIRRPTTLSSATARHRSLPQWIGWNLNKVEQSGSNFGTHQKARQSVPERDRQRTMVSDGLSM